MESLSPTTLTWAEFERVDLRVGTIREARAFPEARRPAYQLLIDFGPEIGLKKSSAQITHHYTPEELVGRQVLAVVNFPPKQIGKFCSEVLVTGLADADGHIVLAAVAGPVPNGHQLV
ncbi:tRNA-binding protein [Hymenobacter siberiensis]|jgi:tRNA-binding protein|uniref:tRNA-binding protein n=1 Tax=Hymenobacter siberiensis TaxID=2848396 RepID=UPI001C1E271A|nr:tRNA-binding protein [Hymenobacter siberiensis]MBU6121303.1 tRNA-binding protein [Hymenobacter siberiensis]